MTQKASDSRQGSPPAEVVGASVFQLFTPLQSTADTLTGMSTVSAPAEPGQGRRPPVTGTGYC